jgi:HK97 family phage portal protein
MAGALERAAAATFRNGVRATGVLSTANVLTADQHRQLRDLVRENHQGAINHGEPFVIDNGMTWTSLSINPDDAQMLESRAFGVEETCRYFGVPPHMIGHTAGTTSFGNGIENLTIGFVQFTLRERLKNIESTLEQTLLSPVERDAGMRIEFNIDGLLRGDSKSRAEFYSAGLKDKWFVVNEVRAKENLPPVPWGDRPWGQMQDTQLNELGQVVPVTPAREEA